MDSITLFRRLLTYARPYWSGFAVAALAMSVTAATEVAFPALMKPLLDNGFLGGGDFQVWWVPAGVIGIFILRGISSFISSYSMSWIANNVLRDLRDAMFTRLLDLPSAAIDSKSSGQIISRIVSEVNGVTVAVTNVVNTLVRDSLILTGLLGYLVWLNWRLALVALILLPLLAAITLNFSRRMRRVSRGALTATGDMTRAVEEAVFGNRVIKIYQAREQEENKFRVINSNYRGQVMRLVIAQALQTPITQLIVALGVAVVLTIALLQTRGGQTTIGDFVSFITAMLMMFSPLRHLADINAQLQRGLASAEAVFSLIDENSEEESGTKILPFVKGKIEFERVSLSYGEKKRDALQNVSLTVEPGTTVALVGPSGGGKSSLVNLIPRLYEPSSGNIRLDGIDLRDISLNSLRKQIAIVSQDIVLFNESIASNVSYGQKNVTQDQIISAIKAADLWEFVCSLPEQLNTVIGDRGVKLSGGQRQRLAIARAVLKNAPILILDEATSALDSGSERKIKAAIDALRKGRTTLVVAHRLETTKDADRIIVFDNGQIVEHGNHDELVSMGTLYSRLYAAGKTQLKQ